MKKRIQISEALTLLENQYPDIATVTEWAYGMGYSRSYFCRQFTKEFGINPGEYLKKFRLRIILKTVKENPSAKSYCIARISGFIDDKALHKHLHFNYGLCISILKAQVTEKAKIGEYLFLLDSRINFFLEDQI